MKKRVSLCLALLTVFILCIINICVIKAEEPTTHSDSGKEKTSVTETTTQSKTSPTVDETSTKANVTEPASVDEESTKATNSTSSTKESETAKSTESASETTNTIKETETATNTKATEATTSYWSGYTNLSAPTGEDTKLSALTVKNFNLSPTFAPNVVEYTLKVGKDVDSVVISATPNDKTSDWRIAGYSKAVNNQIKVDLQTGKNIIKVICTSGAGYSKTYRITITREGVVEKTTSYNPEETYDGSDEVIFAPANKVNWKLVLPLLFLEIAVVAGIVYIIYKKKRNQ